MIDVKARIDEATLTRATSLAEASRGGLAGSEEHSERGGGTGSGWTNDPAQDCRIQNTRPC